MPHWDRPSALFNNRIPIECIVFNDHWKRTQLEQKNRIRTTRSTESLTWLFVSEMGLCEVRGNRLFGLDSSRRRRWRRRESYAKLLSDSLVSFAWEKWFRAVESKSEENDEARLRNLFRSSCGNVGCHRRLSRISSREEDLRSRHRAEKRLSLPVEDFPFSSCQWMSSAEVNLTCSRTPCVSGWETKS